MEERRDKKKLVGREKNGEKEFKFSRVEIELMRSGKEYDGIENDWKKRSGAWVERE